MLLPCMVLIYGLLTGQRPQSDDQETDVMSRNVYADIYHGFSQSLARYVLPTIFLCFGIYHTTMQSLPSTYICSTTIGATKVNMFILQIIGTALDAIIIIGTWRLLKENSDNKEKIATIGSILISSAIILAVLGTVIGFWTFGSIGYLFQFPTIYIWSIVKDAIACAIVIICALQLSSQIGLLSLIFNITCCCVSAPLLISAWPSRRPFPPQSNTAKSLGIFCIFAGYILSTRTRSSKTARTSATSPKSGSVLINLLLTALFIVTEILFLIRTNNVDKHPIYNLMYEARIQGDRWIKEASPSDTLGRAVLEYRTRHNGRDPPPNFDKWYSYALQKGSLVIDGYDSIDRDLLPFWSMEPSDIRRLTPVTSNSTDTMNGIVAITIRNGTAASTINESSGSKDITKMLIMINEFAKWLPDLEIAINIRRQPRVSMPWDKMKPMKKLGIAKMTQKQPGPKNVGFSTFNDEKWSSKLKTVYSVKENSVAQWRPFMPSLFDEKVAPSCSPFSPARQSRGWNPQDFCAKCALPHSDGPFVKNWTLAADLCNQPDIANIHGFFTGEAIVRLDEPPKGILLPIFSRSKITGYNDILFPFPGDYVEPETADISEKGFYEKSDKLFWRGALSSEGISFHHQWQGMLQQRLVHLTTKHSPTKSTSLLLPSTKKGKYMYENVPFSELEPILEKFDTAFTNNMPCLNDPDCNEQVREFGVRESVPFSEQKNYRYLFSLDKNGGSSPDFIPFLMSKSVPFHASIFRSWYDDRLTPWLHFVPQDGRLHAVHSTLAYFEGFKGKVHGREVQMEGKPAEAAFIADQGRKWSNLALRSEDASVYAFRLLLEYSRVVDDNRDNIGYVREEVSIHI